MVTDTTDPEIIETGTATTTITITKDDIYNNRDIFQKSKFQNLWENKYDTTNYNKSAHGKYSRKKLQN